MTDSQEYVDKTSYAKKGRSFLIGSAIIYVFKNLHDKVVSSLALYNIWVRWT
jgi:hypothetical protein